MKIDSRVIRLVITLLEKKDQKKSLPVPKFIMQENSNKKKKHFTKFDFVNFLEVPQGLGESRSTLPYVPWSVPPRTYGYPIPHGWCTPFSPSSSTSAHCREECWECWKRRWDSRGDGQGKEFRPPRIAHADRETQAENSGAMDGDKEKRERQASEGTRPEAPHPEHTHIN